MKKFLEEALLKMQQDLFYVITNARTLDGKKKANGEKAKESLIRSSEFIDQIHKAVKKSFLEKNNNLIFKPDIGKRSSEEVIKGKIKTKKQDITIKFKNSKKVLPLVINVRSQMSSIEKNFDTILERAFAEVVNLRLENNYIMGEVFLIPINELDQAASKENKVKFYKNSLNFEKFFNSYNSINDRKDLEDDKYNFFKCDKICLLVVDFACNPPKLISDFGNDKLNKSYQKLSYEGYCEFLLNKYQKSINVQ